MVMGQLHDTNSFDSFQGMTILCILLLRFIISVSFSRESRIEFKQSPIKTHQKGSFIKANMHFN